MTQLPILYSFRRCPYAMRARMAIAASLQKVELREILLRDKPNEMIAASPKATVPVLICSDGQIVDESLEVMLWALDQNDPLKLLTPSLGSRNEMLDLIKKVDGPFKRNLDNYKYASRRVGSNEDETAYSIQHRDAGMTILLELDHQLSDRDYLYGHKLSLADIAIAPFVRQFANVDANWFALQKTPHLQKWLNNFLGGELFTDVMKKYVQWQNGQPGVTFPAS